MGGKGGSAEIPVVEYFMSVHYGVCAGEVERLSKIKINEKDAWFGPQEQTGVFTIDNEDLFGGIKKEGGVKGRVCWQVGDFNQGLHDLAAAKHGRDADDLPGYRGIATAYFIEHADEDKEGFYWSANSPHVPPAAFKVTRIDRSWRPDIAAIAGEIDAENSAICFAIDRSNSMNWGLIASVPASPSRLDIAQAGVIDVLERLRDSSASDTLDIRIVAWSGTAASADPQDSITRRDCSSADYQDLIDFVGAINTNGGGTNFTYAVQGLADFFDGADDKEPYFLFLTDGEPDPLGSAATAAATLGAIDATKFAFNMVLPNTAYSEGMDNTDNDGVPVIDSLDSARLAVSFLYAFSQQLDMNPAHIIREAIVNPLWGLGLPTSVIDGDSFEAAAETLFSEGFGLSMIWTRQSKIEDFVREVQDHINAMVYVRPTTGLYELKLIRDDYDPDDLPEFDASNATLNSFSRRSPAEVVNEIQLTWTNPDTELEEIYTIQDLGSIVANNGEIVSDNRNYYGVRNRPLAAALAARDISVTTAPLASAELLVDRSAYDIVPGDVVKVTFPEVASTTVTMRVMGVNYGRPGDSKVSLSLTEDIFAYSRPAPIEPAESEAEDLSSRARPPDPLEAMSLPRFFVERAGETLDDDEAAVAILAASDVLDTDSVELYGEKPTMSGSVSIGRLGTRSVVAQAQIAEAWDFEAETEASPFVNYTAGKGPVADSFGIVGPEGLAEDEHEIVLFISKALGVWTVRRGCLDTLPRAWPIYTPIRFLSRGVTVDDPRARPVGVELDYTAKCRTSLNLSAATALSYTPTYRYQAPPRPANPQLESDEAGPIGIGELPGGSGDIVATWANRNRITEETVVLAWGAATVTPEGGQTTTLTLIDDDDDSIIDTIDGLTGTTHTIDRALFGDARTARVRFTAKRDGIESIQGHEISVRLGGGYGFGYGELYGG